MNEFFSKCDVIGHVKLGGVRHSILFSFQFEFVWTFRAWCKYSWKENASLSRKMLAPLTFPSVNALLEFPSVRAMEGPSCSLSFSEHGRLKVETELQVMEMVTSATGCMPQVRNLTGKDFHFLLPQGTWTCVPFRHHVYLHSFLIKKKNNWEFILLMCHLSSWSKQTQNLIAVNMWLPTMLGFWAKARRVCLEERCQHFSWGDLIGNRMVVQLREGIKMLQAGVFLLVP